MGSGLGIEYRIWWILDGLMTEFNTETFEQTSALSAHTHTHPRTYTHTQTHTLMHIQSSVSSLEFE